MFVLNAICNVLRTDQTVSAMKRLQKNLLQNLSEQSPDILKGAVIETEMLKKGGAATARHLLSDDKACWKPRNPNRRPKAGFEDGNNCYAVIRLPEARTFNTAVIDEKGNAVQYFRLQANVNGEWVTIYRSEKLESMRLLSFDEVTTDCLRLSIDKFRSKNIPAKIRRIRLFNIPPQAVQNFEVTAYQRLDGDVPTEILAKGEDYARQYARFYDVYSTVILFGAVHWDEHGEMNFGALSEAQFALEIKALKQIIALRSNPAHKVKLTVTALADGAWGNGHNGVNLYMAQHWETVADKIAAFVKKYDFDGVDIDWEYPATKADWKRFDGLIARLHANMPEGKILSAALSAWNLQMARETLARIDQIQFMAYDDRDRDGFQSSYFQAQKGLADFLRNGADLRKINIGTAAYGRPLNSTPYWASWRDLRHANYWDSKYYNVADNGQLYDGTFCAPALAGDKTALALFSGAGGAMMFRTACDKTMDDPNSVACGIENALKRYIQNW